MIKSWVFELFVPPAELAQRFDPAVSQRHFNAYLDLWASAEPAGFDGIFFSEHHFGASLFAGAQPLDCQRRAANQKHPARRHGHGAALSFALAAGRRDRHARSSHRRAAGDRHRGRHPAGDGAGRAWRRRGARPLRRGGRHHRQGAGRADDLASRQVLEFRQSAPDPAPAFSSRTRRNGRPSSAFRRRARRRGAAPRSPPDFIR